MYELPELDMIRAVLAEKYSGARITKVTASVKAIIGKKSKLIEDLLNATIWFVERRASHVILHLDTGKRLMIFLHSSTRFYGGESGEAQVPGADLVLYFGDRYAAFYHLEDDAAQLVTVRDVESQLKPFAPDPLDKRFTLTYFKSVLAKKRSSLKTFLNDATALTGVGEIYADEILYLACLHPSRKANALTEEEQEKLYTAIVTVLKEAVADGGSITRSLFAQDSFTGSYKEKLNVTYREGEPCNQCEGTIELITVAKQKCYVCPECQK